MQQVWLNSAKWFRPRQHDGRIDRGVQNIPIAFFKQEQNAASTALCPTIAFTSTKCHNSVKNKMCSTCYVPLYFCKASRKSMKLFSSSRKGTHI